MSKNIFFGGHLNSESNVGYFNDVTIRLARN